MEFTNALYRYRETERGSPAWTEAVTCLLKLLAPTAPHLAEELWARRGGSYSIHRQPWPEYDAKAAEEDQITLVVQVNGRMRTRLRLPAGITADEAKAAALATEAVRRQSGSPKQLIYVPGRLVNVVF